MQRTSKLVAGSVVGLVALVGIAVALSTLSGCGREKELPTPPLEGPNAGGSNLPAVVPAVSEDAARRVVDRAIKAMTDGHPERVEKTRVNRSKAKGHYYKPVNNQFQFVVATGQRCELRPGTYQLRVWICVLAEKGTWLTVMN